MRLVIALGGNALLRKGEPLTAENQVANIKAAALQIIKLTSGNELVITHGNGPQVGLLALQNEAYKEVKAYPFDVLSAESEGMIGYFLEQELANVLPDFTKVATILTRVAVDAKDPALLNPTKPIGPIYSKKDAFALAQKNQWKIAPDGKGYRRVVASPTPTKILSIQAILWLLAQKAIVIAAGGGGIPVAINEEGKAAGIEAVIDKDLCSALLAQEIEADALLICTDVDAVYLDWGKPDARAIQTISAKELEAMSFPAGTMGPKVKAACQFVERSGKIAMIGSLHHIEKMWRGEAGTRVIA